MKICKVCKQNKELSEYYKSSHTKCKKCLLEYNKKYVINHRINHPYLYKEYNNKRYNEIKGLANEIKQKSGCIKCKDKRYWVLDFHHIESHKKEYGISNIKNLDLLKQEIEKCIVLCRNCHADFHYLEKIKNITIQNYLGYE